jgi:AcrR family transcriptional regulator
VPERINRRELIINTAGELFLQQGYKATSVRQIAEEVGVTEAALYYHFKAGKRELLQAVFECHMPDLTEILKSCGNANSLADLIHKFGTNLAETAPERIMKFRWLIGEFSNFNEQERAIIHQKQIDFHHSLATLIEPFVEDMKKANTLAWMLICTTFGYGQIFWSLDLKSQVDFPMETLVETLVKLMPSD